MRSLYEPLGRPVGVPAQARGQRIILVAEADRRCRDALLAPLLATGYHVVTATQGEEVLRQVQIRPPHLVLLDVDLPRAGGFDTCRRILELANLPIVCITAHPYEEDEVQALDLGAVDYVTLPVSASVLLARIRAVLRHVVPPSGPETVLHYADAYLSICLDRHQVWVEGRQVHLTRTEYSLLTYLFEHSERPCSMAELAGVLWQPKSGGQPAGMYTLVNRIRHKIEPDPHRPRYVVTIHGFGYQFQC